MPIPEAVSLRQQRLHGSGEMTEFASRLLQFTGIGSSAAAPIERGYSSSPEIFALRGTLSRWPHARSTKAGDTKSDFSQDEYHETDE